MPEGVEAGAEVGRRRRHPDDHGLGHAEARARGLRRRDQAIEDGGGAAVVEHGAGQGDAVGQVESTAPPTSRPAAAFSTTTSRCGPRSPASTARARPALVGGVAADAAARPEPAPARGPAGRRSTRRIVVAVELPHRRAWSWWSARRDRRRRARSAPGRRPAGASTPSIRSAMRGVGQAHDQPADLGRVGHRPEDVERRRDAQLAPGRPGVAQGRVEPGREAERHARRRRCSAATSSGLELEAARRAPRAGRPSRTLDDAARLPCLHTGTPAPATTKEASVDTLMVWLRSPPVPTMSTTRAAHGRRRAPRARRPRAWRRAGRSARRPSRPSCAGPRRSRPAGPGWRRPRGSRSWPPAACSAGRSRPATQRPEHGRPAAELVERGPAGRSAAHVARPDRSVRPSGGAGG